MNPSTKQTVVKSALLIAAILALFALGLSLGSVRMPLSDLFAALTGGECDIVGGREIVLLSRLPRTLTALLAGAALGVGGLLMQTLFRNPLADPFVLGISSGATLGVALVIALTGAPVFAFLKVNTLVGGASQVTAAFIGSALVFMVVIAVARVVRNNMTLLIVGILLGYFTSAVVSVILHFSGESQVKGFIMWTFADFGGVRWRDIAILAPTMLVFSLGSFVVSKSLNALLLGENYAETLGVSVARLRLTIIAVASGLTATITAFCGPIAFIGIAAPHLARSVFGSSDHRVLIPGAMLVGAALALAADLTARLPGLSVTLPLNAVTSLIGAPVVIAFILRKQKILGNLR